MTTLVYDPDGDGKSKLDHVANMLYSLVYSKQLPFTRVQMDSWYAAQKLMALIEQLGKIYYCPLKRLAALMAQSIYQLKYQWLSDCLIEELKHPSIRMQLI